MAFTKIAAAGIGSTETVTLHSLEVLNNATVGGVLTYEDVTNVDSIGIVTARAGVLVGSGITLSKDGDIFATGVTTTGSLVSSGAISGTTGTFSGAISATTGTFTGDVDIQNSNLSVTTTAPQLLFAAAGGAVDTRFLNDGSGNFAIGHGTNSATPTERLRINSAGLVGIGTDDPLSVLHLAGRLSVHHSAVDTEGEFLRIGRTDLPLIRYHSIKAKHGGATVNLSLIHI